MCWQRACRIQAKDWPSRQQRALRATPADVSGMLPFRFRWSLYLWAG
jgi:hypothetical protein